MQRVGIWSHVGSGRATGRCTAELLDPVPVTGRLRLKRRRNVHMSECVATSLDAIPGVAASNG